MMRCLGYAYAAIFKSRAALVAESLLVKYQLLILNRSPTSAPLLASSGPTAPISLPP